MFPKKKSLTRNERLRKGKDLNNCFKQGKKARYKGLTLLYMENKYDINRVSVIARKGFHNAVKRNRQKRLVKEAYRHLKVTLKKGYDIIIFVFPARYSYREYEKMLQFLFYTTGLTWTTRL